MDKPNEFFTLDKLRKALSFYEKLEKQEQQVEKLKQDINNIIKIIGKKNPKIYVYVIPNEVERYKGIENVNVFAVNDKDKYDPKSFAKKAKPGRPGIYIE